MKTPRKHRRLLHSHPRSLAEFTDNLTHLTQREQVHRLMQQHHLRVADMHRAQGKTMRQLSTTNKLAAAHGTTQETLAQRHRQVAAVHERELQRIKQLSDRQRQGLRKIKRRPAARKKRVRAKDEGKLGNITRNQLGTRFATNWVTDYNRNVPRITPQNVPDVTDIPNMTQLQRLTKRLRVRSGKPLTINRLAQKVFRIGTLTNLPPSGIYNDPKQFGFTRSTL